MKKKITVAALVICLVSILVGTSLAYFMDTDEATNTFTVGSVDIEQVEDFDKDTAQLLPVVGNDPATGSNYIKKNVTVKNTGKNDAYVQTYVAVPADLDNAGILKLYDKCPGNGWEKIESTKNVVIENVKYNLYLYRYQSVLPAEDDDTTTDAHITAACLEYVYIDKSTDINTYDTNSNGKIDTAYLVDSEGNEITTFDVTGSLNIYVATQAVQADGFESAAKAFEEAFTNHPWVTN